MARENKTKYALLGLLTMGPMSGYDIKKLFEGPMSHVWSESYGQIYPMLNRLVLEGLAEKSVEKRGERMDRKVFSLTEKGLQEFRQWHNRPIEYQVVRKELLLKLIFGSKVDLKDNIKHVEHFQKMHTDLLMEGETVESDFASRKDDPDARFKLMAARYCMHESRALVEWCNESLEMLRAMDEEEGGQGQA